MYPDLDFFDTLAEAAAAQTLSRFRMGVSVDNKLDTGFDPVTEADKAAERAIRSLIQTHYPEHGILGEEEADINLDHELTWVIDPIDGTRAFISGLPVWGTLVGLYHNGKAVMGMMDQPFTGERFVADQTASYLKRKDQAPQKLKTSLVTNLSEAKIFTTAPEYHKGDNAKIYQDFETKVRLARYGVDCYGFAMVALGTADIAIESGLQPYDIGGLIAPVERAGGIVTNWQGGPAEQGGDVIACANRELHKATLEALNV